MRSIIYMEDIDIVKMFIGDLVKYLKDFEKEILKLEVSPDDNELLNQIIGKVHSIKRGASFVGLSGITRMSREAELAVEAVRDGKISVEKELIDGLLLFVDFLKACNNQLCEKLIENVISNDDFIFFEYDNEQNGKQLLESLKKAHENCRIGVEENSHSGENSEGTAADVLQSEEFKKGLANGIKEQFLIENTEHIEKIENDFLMRLDSNGNDREAVIEIMRALHSIKGGTGIYIATLPPQSQERPALKKFSEVVHTFESLLALIRDRECSFEGKLVDLGFSVVDHLKSFMDSFATDEIIDWRSDDILEDLREQISRIQSLTGNILQKGVPGHGGTIPQNSPIPERLAAVPPQDSALPPQEALDKTDELKLKVSMPQSIRVNQGKIDKMMNMISELIIAKNSFTHISSKLSMEYNMPEISKEVKQVGAYVTRISDELQNAIMSVRMVEIKTVFQKMPRIVRDIAQSTGKKIELYMEGEDTEIDKTIIEIISDPLVHLMRNAADHGIEMPDERLSKGKPETGRIVLRAYNKDRYVYIEIEDDGMGMDTQVIREKAIEKGFVTARDAERMSRNQLLNLIFLPGFSTSRQITEISGRGVGMDIVKSNIAKIRGKINVESDVGKGTKFTIQLPTSLAVSRGLIVEVLGETYIIPLEYIVETVKINKSNIHDYNGKYFTYLRGEVIRIEWLCKLFQTGERDIGKEELNAVVMSNGVENFAIVVDRLRNEQEFVIKTLEGSLAGIPGISGSTLLGNGQVVLIINPVDILQLGNG